MPFPDCSDFDCARSDDELGDLGMTCFDCGKRKNKGIPVMKLRDGTVRSVCARCYYNDWGPWMPDTRRQFPKWKSKIIEWARW